MSWELTRFLSGTFGFFRGTRTFGWPPVALPSDCWRRFPSFSGMVIANLMGWISYYPSSIWERPTVQSYGGGSGVTAKSMCWSCL
jgi:hypothetical protein